MLSNEDADKEYRIERMSAARLKDLEGLCTAVYGKPPVQDYFRRKYDTGYTGLEFIGYIALNRQDIAVAYYGVMPCRVQHGSRIILAAQSGDTMTHPGFRYKGLFVELSNICFDLCRESGIQLIFGFPNQNSYHGAVTKLGWKMTESLDCFSLSVTTLPLIALIRRLPWLKPLYKKYSTRALQKYLLPEAGLPNSVVLDGFAGVLRDERYFQYKKYSETLVVRVGNAKAWISIHDTLVIGDMEVTSRDFASALGALRNLARRLGIRQIFFHASPETHLHRLFAAHSEKSPSFPVLFQDFGAGLPLERIKFTFSDIDIF